MSNLINGKFRIKLNNDMTFFDGVLEADLYIYDNDYKKFKIIYSDKNDKLLVLNNSLNNLVPIYYKDFNEVCKILVQNSAVFKKRKVQELLSRQNSHKRIKFDNDGLERIGDIFSIIEYEKKNSSISKKLFIIAENSYKIKPDRLILIHQDVGTQGEVKLDLNEIDLLKVRLFKEFQICEIENEINLEPICTTIFTEAKYENDKFTLRFIDEFTWVGNSKTSGVNSNVRNPFELIEYMLSKLNLSIEIPNYEYRERSFICIIPMNGLLVENLFGVGTVEFVPRGYLEIDSEFAELLDTTNSVTFAKVYLNANSYSDAEKTAFELANKAIDFIYHIQRTDSLILDGENINVVWSRSNYKIISLSTQILIQDTISNEFIFSLNIQDESNLLKIDTNEFENIIDSISWYEKTLTNEMDGETVKNIKTIFIAIRYLRKSWDSYDLDDKLINTSVAYEFLLEDEFVERIVDKKTRKLIATKSKEYALEVYEGEDKEEKAIQIYERVNFTLSSPILEQKLINLLNRLNINLTNLDKETLKSVREMRNKLVHGRGIPSIKVEVINLANGIIAHLLLNKLKDRMG
ncbi:MAG: hypothetical protein E6778_14785 [Niallia nealsonii]|nr:hypothetical protein [Niallia nealsonii]